MEVHEMAETSAPSIDDSYLEKVTEAAVRVGLVLLLLAWCFNILRPFITPVVWGGILAVAIFPAHRWLTAKLSGRARSSAVLDGIL